MLAHLKTKFFQAPIYTRRNILVFKLRTSTNGLDIEHGVFYDPLRCWTRNRSVVEAIRFNPMMISDEYLSTFTDLVVEVEPDC